MASSFLPAKARVDHAFLEGGGLTSDLIRATDWSKTLVGPIASWPTCLKTIVGTLVRSRHPMFLWWGPDLVQFYNDAYVPSFGVGKHPAAMGQKGRECWEESWPIIGPQIDDVMSHGRASWHDDARVPTFRNGRIEEVYWTYGFSPVVDEEGQIRGTLVVCTETTSRVVAQRRLHVIENLAGKLVECADEAGLLDAAFSVIASANADLPFALTYSDRNDSATARSNTSPNVEGALRASLEALLREHVHGATLSEPTVLSVPPPPILPGGPWPELSSQVFIVPARSGGGPTFVFGISPRLPFDDAYRAFLELFVERVAVRLRVLDAERTRGEVEAERRNLLLQAPMPTALLTGPQHRFELANAPYRQMVGGREVVGKTYFEAFPDLVDTEYPALLDRIFRTGERYVTPEAMFPLDLRGDGVVTECFFRFTLEPLRNSRREVYGIMAVAVDITEQVNARRVLEQSASEREALLHELEAASRAKDEFLATVSHELRTPLTAMLGWARLLDERSDPARLKKGLLVIKRSAKAQAQLIEDILDVSRIITGKIRMDVRSVDLATVVNAAVETVRPAAAAKEVSLRVDVDESLGSITADEARLQQIVWNLLSNAVKFTPKGGNVALGVARTSSHATITVRDTGRGIAASFLPHIFERFRQDDSSTTRQQAGLGLGLAIVRHLVELHGGTVSVASEGEGTGARFEVCLPAPTDVAADKAPSDRGSGTLLLSNAPVPLGRLNDVHVLVVDDEEDAREFVSIVLEDAGAHVSQAPSASAAVRFLASSTSPVSVIVSDVGMPGEDGYAFLRRVRAADSPRTRRLPALALTAYAHAEDREKALAAGFHEHVAKPIDPAKLVDVVAALARR